MGRGQFHLTPTAYLDLVRAEGPAYDRFEDAVAEASANRTARTVLDLGVGTGETARRVLDRHRGAHLVAIDGSEEMVAIARRSFPDADVRVGQLEDPLPEGRFDLVISA